jgi:hypothetical protein
MKMALIKEKEYHVRYFTYYLYFPGEQNDPWVDQTPFIHDLQFQLKNTTFGKVPGLARDILQKGECSWTDQNGVKHRVVVEDVVRPKKWGHKRTS